MSAVDVLVAIPAHNEASTIAACVDSVGRAVTAAQRRADVGRARVAIGLHRCTDETEAKARWALAAYPSIQSVFVTEHEPMAVGLIRTRLIDGAAAAARALKPESSWIFSTDADTVVPEDWIVSTLAQQRAGSAELILGLADIVDWDADEPARRAYRDLIEAGLTGHGHRHVYAANLAIRLAAFQQVGGFPGLPHGEEHGLAAAVRKAGLGVLTTLAPQVRTSARMPGRASQGLGALLAGLAAAGQPSWTASSPAAQTSSGLDSTAIR